MRSGLDAQREAVENYLNGGRWSLVAEFTEIESGKPLLAIFEDEAPLPPGDKLPPAWDGVSAALGCQIIRHR